RHDGLVMLEIVPHRHEPPLGQTNLRHTNPNLPAPSGHAIRRRPVRAGGRGSQIRLNSTTHTHGFDSHGWPRLALIASQRSPNRRTRVLAHSLRVQYGFAISDGISTPSAIASASVISCTRSTRTET